MLKIGLRRPSAAAAAAHRTARSEPAADPQPLLGVMEDLDLMRADGTLDPGDVLLCVTDGVTERREGTRMLGDDGLAEVLAQLYRA